MDPNRKFDRPEDFLAWVQEQALDVQQAVIYTIGRLIEDQGVSPYVAAHATYKIAAEFLNSGMSVQDFSQNRITH